MAELPVGWVKVTFDDVVDVNPRKSVDLSPEDIVTFVPMAAVDEVSGTIANPIERPLKDVNRGFTQFAENDVIFAKITPSMENGKSAVSSGLANGIGFGSTEFHVFRSRGAVSPTYLWRFVRQQAFRSNAQQVMSGAVGQQRVPAEYLKTHALPLPPLPEQERIIGKTNSLSAHVIRAGTELARIPSLITRYKRQLLELAMSGELTRTWRSGPETEEWRFSRVEEVAEAVFDGPFGSNLKSSDYSPSGIRVVRLENIGNLEFIREKETYIPKGKFARLRRYEIQPSDVLFSSFMASEVRVCLFPSDLPTQAINKADCFCIRVNKSACLPEFLLFRLACPSTYETLRKEVHGTTRPRISLGHLRDFGFNLPSLGEQAEIVRRIDTAFTWLDHISKEQAKAAKLLPELEATIFAKAFRGQLVSQDPNDEPANITLARVNAEWAARPRGHRQTRPTSEAIGEVSMDSGKNLEQVLIEAGDWLPAQTVFLRCGISDGVPTEDIERLYAELRELDKAGRLETEAVIDDQGRKLYDRLRLKVS